MGLFRKIDKMAAESRKSEEVLYAMALQEVTNDDVKPGLWGKAFAHSEGDEKRTQATYLKLRVQQMRDELSAFDEAFRKFDRQTGTTQEPAGTPSEPAPSPVKSYPETVKPAAENAPATGSDFALLFAILAPLVLLVLFALA